MVSNKNQYQSFDSDVCGELCITWLMTQVGPKNWMKEMNSSNLDNNTELAKNVVKSLDNRDICFQEARSLCNQISKTYNNLR